MLCGAAHKGIHGIMGCGFLVFSKRIFVNPLIFGGTGTESANPYQPKEPPESLESGTLNLPAIAALEQGLLWTEKHFSKINAKCAEISFYLHAELQNAGVPIYSVAGSPLLTFALPAWDSQTVADILNQEYGIAVRAGLHCAPLMHKALKTENTGLGRASIGANNTMRQAKRLAFAIKDVFTR